STTGAPLAFGGISIDCRSLTGIEDLDVDGQEAFVTVLPGTPLGALKRELQSEGWLLPPDPTSTPDCTAGGIVATNANGPRSLIYGATRNWVDAVELIDGRGTIAWWQRSRAEKHGSGFSFLSNPLDLLCGAEGTVGVFRRIRFRCIRAPEQTTGMLIPCPDLATAVALVSQARRDRLPASCIEGFDATALEAAASAEPRLRGVQAALWVEIDHPSGAREQRLSTWEMVLRAHQLDADVAIITEASGLKQAHAWRHRIPESLNAEGRRLRDHGGTKLSTDWCVPVSQLGAAFGVVDDLLTARGLAHIRHARYGHFGSGHPHHNWITRNHEETTTMKRLIFDAATQIQRMGGWFAAEHGIGKLKRALAESLIQPSLLAAAREARRTFDPHGLCAPGNLCMP
ncbi:MAG: FAD-binding oxidoreductase, partial [Candidatus Dadabacteria bacterium]